MCRSGNTEIPHFTIRKKFKSSSGQREISHLTIKMKFQLGSVLANSRLKR